MKKLWQLLLCIIFILVNGSQIKADDLYPSPSTVQTFRVGDTLTLPIIKDSYVAIITGYAFVWYDDRFSSVGQTPIRNYQTSISYTVTKTTPIGCYQILSIYTNGDPTNVNDWKYIALHTIQILHPSPLALSIC